jgi:hypothetical protein
MKKYGLSISLSLYLSISLSLYLSISLSLYCIIEKQRFVNSIPLPMYGPPTVWSSRFADQFKNWLMRLKLVGRWVNCTVSKQILEGITTILPGVVTKARYKSEETRGRPS